ncbi:uncharacterized protein HMPREF1541_05539 [Cyphellophora europaea CBS 101466]|uniref:Major facilitator superfamily (MFS) profile domain-containing protein n=1 Tax=Cyphellophora europaea (strain CBS 101466) TaxID=1220924 RepID=W2RS21_CYPE1|nr:uncharacterized protein HMPREF1541_05539 [Cyphellophora europaea CBS 101466]ETN39316.1 hypothetical protein HMPREF1541_05539 [Cyphellophora europaea CBS 101466]
MADIEKHPIDRSPSASSIDKGRNAHIENEKAADMPVISGVRQDPDLVVTQEEEDRVIRKLDWRLLPFVFVLYSLSVLDRSNLGNARLAGLEDDIDLTGNRYQLLGTIFYIAYILSQWLIIGWKIFPPHIYCTIAVFFWGVIATVQAAVTSWGALMACRFLLGIGEAMFGPGVPLYLSFFYPRDRVGFRQGVFISGAAMANAYGGALAYGISQIHGSIAPWQILFIIEGLPTVCIAFVAWFILPDSLAQCKFLSDREKQIASQAVARNQQADPDRKSGFKFKQLLAAFKDPKSYIPGIMYFSCNVSFASLPLFVPTIISGLGVFTKIQSNGLSAPPYVLCFFMILLLTFLSDRYKMRAPFIIFAALVAAIGFILQATCKSPAARYTGVFLAVQVFCCVALTLAWVSNIHSTESKRAGAMTILATIGQCGPLLGTNVFPESEKPYYHKGMWISASFCLLIAACSVALAGILIRENKQMERQGLIPKKGETRDGLKDRDVEGVPRYR